MWADRVGSDIWYDILQSSRAREGVENVPESWREETPLVDRMVKNGALGRKSGRGLYVVSATRYHSERDATRLLSAVGRLEARRAGQG